jgi:flagellar hook-associated protein 3 FlgL
MSVLPVSVNRTNHLHANLRLLRQVNADQVSLQRLYDQLSTNRRVLVPSDDAPAATRAIRLTRSLELSQQHLRNSQASQRVLGATDGLLSDLASLVIESRALAVEGAQTILSDEERATLTQNLKLTFDQLIATGTRKYEGQYLLSGAQDSLPLEQQQDFVRWNVNETFLESFLSTDGASKVSSNLPAAFGLDQGIIKGSVDLAPGISRDTLLTDLNDGQGIKAADIRLLEPTLGVWKTVPLEGLQTVGQLVDQISAIQLDGRPLQATITTDRVTLNYQDGLAGSIIVDESLGGDFARQLGWKNGLGTIAPPLGERNLQLAITEHTLLSDLRGGAGIDVSSGIQVTQGGERFTIEFPNATTIGDIVAAINRSEADVHATLDSLSNRLQIISLRHGVDLGIGENGGTLATDLGIRTATGDTQLRDLHYGSGIQTVSGADFVITRTDGSTLAVDLDGLATIADLLQAINTHVANAASNFVQASLATNGNGIVLTSVSGTNPLQVDLVPGSNAAWILGLVPQGARSALGNNAGATATLAGTDYHGRAIGGLLDTIQRMVSAIEVSNFAEIGRLQSVLDSNTAELDAERAQLGIETQTAQAVQQRVEDDQVRLQSGLSDNLDADFAQVVSDISLRQASLEASLRFVAQTARLSLLDFL